MKSFSLKVLGIAVCLMSPLANAMEMKNRLAYCYAAAGQLYGLSSLRVGRNSFEVGVINPGAYGIGKAIRSDKSIGLATFGFAYNYTKSYGIYGSVGTEFRFILPFLNFRAEVLGSVYNDTSNFAGVLIGGVFHI